MLLEDSTETIEVNKAEENVSAAPAIKENSEVDAELQAVEASMAKEDQSLDNSEEGQTQTNNENEETQAVVTEGAMETEDATAEDEQTNDETSEAQGDMTIPKKTDKRFRIFCGMIKKGTTEKEFRSYWTEQGVVVELFKMNTARPFAFISVDSEQARVDLCNATHTVNGNKLNLQPAKPKTKKFFVGGTKASTTDEMLKEHFSQYGDVTEAFVVKGRGFGFVTMEAENTNAFGKVLEAAHKIDDRDVDVKYAQPKPDDQRRGGFQPYSNGPGYGPRGYGGRGGGRGGYGGGRGGYGGGYGGPRYGGGYGAGGYGPRWGGRGGYGYGPRW